ncbi:MAG: signal recognition particle-docking protein FtsY [Endozoicomonas sp. (ex Botrylloides leachii)]|nr:signal recognition particle-docking protein FtsY [Endozoicomonas sp. (ex Botrylloides leachii)]
MFGSRKDDQKTAKRRRIWPWNRRNDDKSQADAAALKENEPTTENCAVSVENTEAKQAVGETETGETVKDQSSKDQSSADRNQANTTPINQQPESTISTTSAVVHQQPADLSSEFKEKTVPQASAGDVDIFGVPAFDNAEQEVAASTAGFFTKMRKGLSKTRNVLIDGVAELFIGRKDIDDDLLEELETQLLVSDVGVEATTEIIKKLTDRVKYRELDDVDALMGALKAELRAMLEPADKPLVISEQKTPYVILIVGVNGAGKTTTIGKLASRLKKQNKSVMLAAGDTFRAAAVEQLQVWGERNQIPVIAQHTGADSASVVYDAFEAAKARGVDILIADTAGRLHNKEHLMEELKKVKRVLGKLDEEAPHEVLLVIDAGTGQNALSQAKLFHETVKLTGMALTKLDGTAKGGVIFALSRQMQLPIRFLGIGEQIDDLRPFVASEFVDALFDDSKGKRKD